MKGIMLKEFDRINTLQLYNHTLMNFTNVFLEAMQHIQYLEN